MLYEFAGGDGAAVIAGTGSVGFCKKDGQVLRIGGYGYLFDKGGSGYDYGRDAIYHALCAAGWQRGKDADRQAAGSANRRYSGKSPRFVSQIKAYIASFAPIVFEAYRQGDTVAKQIVHANTKELASIFRLLAQHQEKDVCEVVLSGSIWNEFDLIRPHLLSCLNTAFRFILCRVPPVYGAAIQAALQAGYTNITEFKETLSEGIS